MANQFVNSWKVNSEDKLANRPDGKPYNEDFPKIPDYDEESCVARMLSEGSSEMDGCAEWARYMSASSPAEILAYEVFIMAMVVHENELLEAKVASEDAALRFRIARDDAKKKLLENRRRAAAGETAEMRAQAAIIPPALITPAGMPGTGGALVVPPGGNSMSSKNPPEYRRGGNLHGCEICERNNRRQLEFVQDVI